MQALLYAEINAICMSICIIMLVDMCSKKSVFIAEHRFFILLLIGNMSTILFDTLMWVLDGTTSQTLLVLNITATAAYYALNPFVCLVWAMYTIQQINAAQGGLLLERTPFRKLAFAAFAFPAAASAFLSVASAFTGWMFYFDSENVYHRGKLFPLMMSVSFFYFLFSFAYVFAKSKGIGKRRFYVFILVPLLPFAAAAVQSAFYGVSLIWPSLTIAILMLYLNIQNLELHTDYLTGLYNRRQLDLYLEGVIRSGAGGKQIAGIMLDIDSFKLINDALGHAQGDAALEQTAEIIRAGLRKGDFVARYGGDEFVAILLVDGAEDLEKVVRRISESVEEFNRAGKAPYRLGLSIGYDIYPKGSGMSCDMFLKRIDTLMYEQKRMKSGE